MTRAAVALALSLMGCGAATAPGPDPAPSGHVFDADGIALVGSPLRIDFGRAEPGAVAAFSRLEGRDPSGSSDCGGGVRAVSWPGGTTLQFRNGGFLGWSLPDGTSAGVTCPT